MDPHYSILQSVVRKEAGAFDKLYAAISPLVYNTAISALQDIQQAEDVTQDVFVKIYRAAHTFKGDSKVTTWAYSIASRTIIDHQRKLKRNKMQANYDESEAKNATDFIHPGSLMEDQEAHVEIFKAIDLLPEKQKMVFILAYIEGLPRQEIADITDSTLKAIESLLQRAKRKLRELIKKN